MSEHSGGGWSDGPGRCGCGGVRGGLSGGSLLAYAVLQHVDLLAVRLRLDPEHPAPIALKQAIEVGGPSKHKHHRTVRPAVYGVQRVQQAERRRRAGAGVAVIDPHGALVEAVLDSIPDA